ncbi:LamG domain-containing protein [Cryptosporangium sp. NPDC048952]|uniref:LamG domain-containing protein n=1 Tax=Cryptosporangium sp. NPDC048952 TaxID=3363961 RepID=UPI003721DDA9
MLHAPTAAPGGAAAGSASAGGAATRGAEAPSEVTVDPWGQPAAVPFVLAEPEAVPSFDAGGPPPEEPASRRRMGVLVAVAAVLVVAVVAGIVLVSGVFSGDDEPTAKASNPSVPAPTASPSAVSSSPAASPSPTVAVSSAPAPAPVPAGPQPVAAWGVQGGKGDAGVGGQNLTPTNVTAVGGSGGFNGKDSQMTTSSAVVRTGAGSSFTVAASVFLAGTEGYQTAVSQDGAVNSAFFLQYSWAEKKWAFSRVGGDAANAAGVRALSNAPAATRTWVRLVGVYDARAGQLRLYVDGVPQGTATYQTPFASTGKFAVGRAKFNGKNTDWFRGNISDVTIYDAALTPAEVTKLTR